jgi:ubiquinone/menaquinone biosynthesis C-methylase UbiE
VAGDLFLNRYEMKMNQGTMERRFAHAVDSQSAPDNFYEKIKPRLRQRIGEELRTARRVLDLGCGNCGLDRYLARKYRKEVTGVDISDGSFPSQGSLAGARGILNCIRADASHLEFVNDAGMDAVVSVWALHEIKDTQGALVEAYRVLRPGGRMLIVDFPKGSLAQRLWNENYLTPSKVGALLQNAGFVEVCVRTIHKGQVTWAVGFRPLNAGT